MKLPFDPMIPLLGIYPKKPKHYFKKIKMNLPFDPVIPLLGIYPKNPNHKVKRT